MYWFKNAMIYRLTKSLNLDDLQDKLNCAVFTPCEPSDSTHFGWTPPLKDSGLLHHTAGENVLLVAKKETKILPAEVVNKELNERIEKLEKAEGRKLKKVEKQTLKDDVITTLLPRAFSKYQHTALWIDTKNDLIYVDAASSNRAEDVLALLRKTLGSLPVVPLAFKNEPAVVMSRWIADENAPEWLIVKEDLELRSKVDDGVIKCKNNDLAQEEILTLADRGFVTKLALEWENNLSFVLNDDCTLKRLKFEDQIREKNDDILKEDVAQRFDADFILMTATLSELVKNLINEFGGEKEHL
ncbi:MAG: recombination-associated protein RdgC [Haemophilus parainfluenzae]|nr:recombination-associated protein RdgC [Haemophilus parainfluenzae]MDU1101065.1 recombination-associated protein RdgC [Haemophilus parainfluenzae]MDU6908905.1 recombination-associated protein RdgC [Haemophilus parainfluenzae]